MNGLGIKPKDAVLYMCLSSRPGLNGRRMVGPEFPLLLIGGIYEDACPESLPGNAGYACVWSRQGYGSAA